jgi:hypothetical protein
MTHCGTVVDVVELPDVVDVVVEEVLVVVVVVVDVVEEVVVVVVVVVVVTTKTATFEVYSPNHSTASCTILHWKS